MTSCVARPHVSLDAAEEVVPLPPGQRPINVPLFAFKAFAVGTLLCAAGGAASVLAFAYWTDLWTVCPPALPPPKPPTRSAVPPLTLIVIVNLPQIEAFGKRMREVVPPRTQWLRDLAAPLRRQLGTDHPPSSPPAPPPSNGKDV